MPREDMQIIGLTGENIDTTIGKALDLLRNGGIIAYPTETFYGLGAKFDLPDSLKKLYDLKRRPREKAMPLIIGDRKTLSTILLRSLSPAAEALTEQFWPGPLTLLLPAKEGLSEYLTAHTGKIAVRIPGESFALYLARKAGFPITATSANLSGMPPADDGETVMKYFDEDIDLLVDGGKTPGGAPSTIVDVSGEKAKVVRQGAIKLPEA